MSSLDKRLEELEKDLLSDPLGISVYHDLPFAIFLYKPQDEFAIRGGLRKLEARLKNEGKDVIFISLAELLWQGIDETRGMEYIVEAEQKYGYKMAERTVANLISSKKFRPLPDMLTEHLQELDPRKTIVFLVRAGAMAPSTYRMSKLLDEMHGRIMIPLVLFYPGEREGEGELRFMGIEGREGISGYNYRVRIYDDQ
jgi:hypothetical protein